MENKSIPTDFEATLQLASMIGLETSPNHFVPEKSTRSSSRRMCLADWRILVSKARHQQVRQRSSRKQSALSQQKIKPFDLGDNSFDTKFNTSGLRNVKTALNSERKAMTAQRRNKRIQQISQRTKNITVSHQTKKALLQSMYKTKDEKPPVLQRKKKKQPKIKIRFNKKTNKFQFI